MGALTIMAKKLFGLSPTPEDYGTVWAQAPTAADASSDYAPLERRFVAILKEPGCWDIETQRADIHGGRRAWYWDGSVHNRVTTANMLDFLREQDQTVLPENPNHISHFLR